MTKNKDTIGKALDLQPVEKNIEEVQQIVDESKDVLSNDFEIARKNLHQVINKSTEAVTELLNIANQTESPRAFEVSNLLLKTISDASITLLEASKKKQDIENEKGSNYGEHTTNNLLITTTSDLLRSIKAQEKEENTIDVSSEVDE